MTVGGGRKGKRLSSEDIALWDGVTRSIKPLRKRSVVVAPDDKPAAVVTANKPAAKLVTTAKPVRVPASQPVGKPAPPAPISLDRRTRQKIARGHSEIDAKLDLHGYTQAEAHAVLLGFLHRTQMRGGRVALVITGKGRGGEIGALKRAVPLWLALPEFRSLVIGFDTAAIGHGGEGALYVRLKKVRE